MIGDIGTVSLSVVAPRFNERANVEEIVRRPDRTMAGRGWEMLLDGLRPATSPASEPTRTREDAPW